MPMSSYRPCSLRPGDGKRWEHIKAHCTITTFLFERLNPAWITLPFHGKRRSPTVLAPMGCLLAS
jgi:hypothetical protein